MMSMTPTRQTPRRDVAGSPAYAHAAAAGTLVAMAAVLALHALRRDLEPASHRLSEYATGPWGWLMTLTFAAVAAALWLLGRALPTTARLRPVRALLTIAAIGFGLSAVFPTDPMRPDALRETAHTVASTGALMALTAGAVWTVTRGADALGWRGARGTAAAATAVATVCVLISPVVHNSPWTGAVQRLCCLALTVWLLLLCRAVGQPERAGSSDHPDAGRLSDGM